MMKLFTIAVLILSSCGLSIASSRWSPAHAYEPSEAYSSPSPVHFNTRAVNAVPRSQATTNDSVGKSRDERYDEYIKMVTKYLKDRANGDIKLKDMEDQNRKLNYFYALQDKPKEVKKSNKTKEQKKKNKKKKNVSNNTGNENVLTMTDWLESTGAKNSKQAKPHNTPKKWFRSAKKLRKGKNSKKRASRKRTSA
eukprot:214779_1